MALIKCPECGGKVSDRAENCIHCGYPIRPRRKSYATDDYDPYKSLLRRDMEEGYERDGYIPFPW